MADPETKAATGPKKLTITQMKVIMQALAYDIAPRAEASPYTITVAGFSKTMRDEIKGVADFLAFLEPYEPELKIAIKASMAKGKA